MGCGNSKLDNLPAVALCRDRCKFLHHSLLSVHSLAAAHSAYAHSLNTLPAALHRFLGHSLPSKIQDLESSSSSPSFDLSSNSDSQQQCPSDSDDGDSDQEFGTFVFPPPPPTSSSWDFLKFFDTYEGYESVNFAVNWDFEGGGAEKFVAKRVSKKSDFKPKCEARVEDGKLDGKKSDQLEKKNDSSAAESAHLSVSDAMREIKASFEKASESGNGISKLLSNGQRTCFSEDGKTSSRGLSSILKKLFIWEEKLYLEVKAEERLRLVLEKKCKQLKHFAENKTDARKVDSLRTQIRDLSIKLKVSIQVVDRISITISNLRDEEFFAEITELIHGFCSMWKAMLECHKNQSQILMVVGSFDTVFNGKLDDVHLEAAMDLKLELQKWGASFSNWIATQRDCVKDLNGWLLRCLFYEPGPEDTPNDAWQPFSPARSSAPPVFVLCNSWSETMDEFSDKEVSEAIHGLVRSVDQLLEQHEKDLQRMAMANRDLEKKMKGLDMGDQKTKTKKTVAVAAESLYKSSTLIGADVKSGLKQTFLTLARFSGDSIKAFEELCATMAENSQTAEKKSVL